MRKLCLFLMGVSALLITPCGSQAQIVNGNFETRTSVPTDGYNVGPASRGFGDVLPNWDSPASNASYNYPGTLVSTDGTNRGSYSFYQQAGYYFPPRSGGISAVQLYQHDVPGDHQLDQFVYQQLASPLTPGHRYRFSFFALRTDKAPYRTKLALSVTTDVPYYQYDFNSPGTLTPSPGKKVVVAQQGLLPGDGWVEITGTVDIPCSETTNQWITIGYDRSDQIYDASLDTPPPGILATISHYVDDVTMTDLGPYTPPIVGPSFARVGGTCYYDFQIEPIEGATSYYVQLSNGDSGYGSVTSNSNGYVRFGFLELGPATVNATVTITLACGSPYSRTYTNRTIPRPPANCMYRQAPLATAAATPTEQLAVYPNPAVGSLTVELAPDLRAQELTLVDLAGKTVRQVRLDGTSIQLATTDLASGLYTLRVSTPVGVLHKRVEISNP